MTTNDFIQYVFKVKNETPEQEQKDDATVFAAAQLISGSFTLSLYGELWKRCFDMDGIVNHLESLYDNGNHHGLIYFIVLLAEAAGFTLPVEFADMSAKDAIVPILSSAVIEDWLEYSGVFDAAEHE